MKRVVLLLVALVAIISDAKAQTLCPDGTYVNGPCQLAPNGRFVGGGGNIQLAPNGDYVAGQPRLTPNGGFIGGSGAMSLCPDGSYVAGQCQLTPNGRFIGR
jgi:hypothetical protein